MWVSANLEASYDEMVADPQVTRDNQWPHTVALLRLAKEHGCLTGLATLSARQEAIHFLRALEHRWVVHDPDKLLEVIEERIAEHNRATHRTG